MATNRAFGRIQEDRKKTSFFKVLTGEDLSSESMRMIPHKFWRGSECKNFPLKVILKVVWGRSWTVNLSKFMGFYLMERKGWEEFLNDNQLGDDEFLTFTTEGNNCLTVAIFQKNCKEILRPRNTTIVTSCSSYVKIEDMSYDAPVRAESRRGAKERKERAEEEVERMKSKKMKNKADNNVYGASSSTTVAKFSLTIKQSHLLVLTIPTGFAKEHMPKKRTKFVVHDPKGKPWEVVFVYSDGPRVFSSGWRFLARDYGLAVGDLCTFRLIKPKEMVLEVLHTSP